MLSIMEDLIGDGQKLSELLALSGVFFSSDICCGP